MKRGLILATVTTAGVFGLNSNHENISQSIQPANTACVPGKVVSGQAACELGRAGLTATVRPNGAPEPAVPSAQLPTPTPATVPQPEAVPTPMPPAPAPIPAPESAPKPAPAPAPEQSPTPAPAPAPAPSSYERGRIYILGDSLTNGTSKEALGKLSLESLLIDKGWNNIRIRAACGRPLIGDKTFSSCDNGRPIRLGATAQLETDELFIKRAEAVVIALGTNDYAQNPVIFEKKARFVVNTIHIANRSTRILWPNIYLAGRGDSYAHINTVIRNLDRVEPVDYASNAMPYYRASCGSDGVHPSCPGGYSNRAKIIASRIGSPGS